LLAHIREAFDDERRDRLPTVVLLAHLVKQETGPWGDWWARDIEAGNTKGTASRLAKLLKPHGIKPKPFRLGAGTERGYERAAFKPAWARYLPAPDPAAADEDVTTQHPSSEAVSERNAAQPVLHPDMAADQQGYVVTSSDDEGKAKDQ